MKNLLSPKNLTLAAVACLLFLVSVPRVHQLAVQDNQRDAQSALRALSAAVSEAPDPATLNAKNLSSTLSDRLRDVRFNEECDLIQRHGYLFEVFTSEDGKDLVRAWPVSHGDTGVTAYLIGPDSPLMTNQNSHATWSGAGTPRPTGTESGWIKAPTPR